ncbi:MAG: DUF882 domain-containing protein [Pseudomonadota bacterium]
MNINQSLTRRSLVKAAFATSLLSLAPSLAYSFGKLETRSLYLYNTHTGESLQKVYWEKGLYINEALKDINYILRDFRTHDVRAIDTNLLDLMYMIHAKMETTKPFEIISGYRSPKTNQMLHKKTTGVAYNSNHLIGKAIDVRLSCRPLKSLRDTAIAMQQGGVGYYPKSDFVHIDTGGVRYW